MTGNHVQPPTTRLPGSSHEPADCILIRQIAASDARAFEQLYRSYAPRLAAYLSRMLSPSALVDEVYNDVMLVVWQQAAQFDHTKRLSSWIFGIARHKALMARRTAAAQTPRLPLSPVADAATDPEVQLTRQEQRRLVRCALAILGPEERTLVGLVYEQQQPYQNIAAHLGCPVNTVKTRMRRIRQRLMPPLLALGVAPARQPHRRKGSTPHTER